ncbi:MAG: hypothetical protein OXN90_20095 [Gemmatimonadota bacterium]|nr:hypothetical protein [Caldilineaceae bacterium]MDE2810723.1 hypothetical protein [Gemmatimonadota bacterium]
MQPRSGVLWTNAPDVERVVFVYADPHHGTANVRHSWGTAHREFWTALWDHGLGSEVVAVSRTFEKQSLLPQLKATWRD